jgi:hypothetical protein
VSTSSYHGGDPAEYPQASIGFDFDAVDEALSGRAVTNIEMITVPMALFKLLALLVDSNDYMLEVDVAIAAVGIPFYQGCSFTDMAKKHGISKQAFDKRVIRFQRDFQLPITRAQKSAAARASYQKTQLDRVERLKQKNQQLKKGNEEQWQSSLRKEQKVQSAA